MRWWIFGLASVMALSFAAGCSDGAQRTARREVDLYNMKSYNQGNQRQLSNGTTLNTGLLQALKAESSKRSIRLTHETYAEDLNGKISYTYFINGDARHFVNVHVFPTERDRVEEMAEVYGGQNGSVTAASAEETSVMSQKGKVALIYASSGMEKSKYNDDMKKVFDKVLSGMNMDQNQAPRH
ncbi:hypothetical protein [Paenibacillus sp. DYY-L-2]|uniref:hypothetical protein n=1 Tax=Paenibacillus sp. DYY-L-2 TaxID=3447013 RepID=UPI003F5065CD